MLPNIQASIDFVVARLHGLMASSVRGDTLENLAKSTTEELLRRNLRSLGIDCANRAEYHNFIYEREIGRIDRVARMLPAKAAAFYIAIEARVYFENLKTALHWRFSRGERSAAAPEFTESPNTPRFDSKAIGEARDGRAFMQCIPQYGVFGRDELASIVRGLEETGNLLMSDSAVDQAYYAQLWHAAHSMKSAVGHEACRLLGIEIDILNLNTLMRNAQTYHFDASVMSRIWLDNGEMYDRHSLDELAKKHSLAETKAALNGKYRRILDAVEGQELYQCENALWNHLYSEAHRSFLAIDEPSLSIAAFPFLVHFETLNLGRIYEGIYFGIPSQNILDIMIGGR